MNTNRSENIVEQCLKTHLTFPDTFFRSKKNGKEDSKGVDFRITVCGIQYDIQVKTCHKTLAVILPLSEKNAGLMDWRIRKRVIDHSLKHGEVKYIIFVCRSKEKSGRVIADEVWEELTEKIFPAEARIYKIAV